MEEGEIIFHNIRSRMYSWLYKVKIFSKQILESFIQTCTCRIIDWAKWDILFVWGLLWLWHSSKFLKNLVNAGGQNEVDL